MALQSMWEFLCGHVNVVIKGKGIEKFINMATSRGILLWNIVWQDKESVRVSVRISGLKPIAFLCKQLGCSFKIVAKKGMPFYLWRVQRRKALAGGALIFVVLLYCLSAFVWSIQVVREGPITIDNQTILKSARKAGLRQRILKSRLDFAGIEQQITEDFPNVSFVDTHIKGTRIIVSVVEKKLKPKDEQNKLPSHIVATKQGLVTEVLVTQGQGVVKAGEIVQPGQILISGEVLPIVDELNQPPQEETETGEEEEAPKPIKYVPARGIVKARVWYNGYGESQLRDRQTLRTGRSTVRISMKIGDKEIILKGPKKVEFKQFVQSWTARKIRLWRNIVIPVEVVTTDFYETKSVNKRLSQAQAKAVALERAEAEIKQNLPKGAKILKKEVTEVSGHSNLVQLEASWEVVEDIGRIQPMRR